MDLLMLTNPINIKINLNLHYHNPSNSKNLQIVRIQEDNLIPKMLKLQTNHFKPNHLLRIPDKDHLSNLSIVNQIIKNRDKMINFHKKINLLNNFRHSLIHINLRDQNTVPNSYLPPHKSNKSHKKNKIQQKTSLF